MIIPTSQATVEVGDDITGRLAHMDFTRTGRVFAHIFFWYGVLGVAVALYYAFFASGLSHDTRAITAYLSEEVGQGMTSAFMGLALGVLCEISAKRSKPDDQA